MDILFKKFSFSICIWVWKCDTEVRGQPCGPAPSLPGLEGSNCWQACMANPALTHPSCWQPFFSLIEPESFTLHSPGCPWVCGGSLSAFWKPRHQICLENSNFGLVWETTWVALFRNWDAEPRTQWSTVFRLHWGTNTQMWEVLNSTLHWAAGHIKIAWGASN